ncbi:MAG: hypothetical protein AAFY32_11305, partial [Pseudomonadota bacterium]
MSDKFYITLDDKDKAKVQEILETGRYTNAGDIIRDGIALSHRKVASSRTMNADLRKGLTALTERV